MQKVLLVTRSISSANILIYPQSLSAIKGLNLQRLVNK
jgi:hypothetical protein